MKRITPLLLATAAVATAATPDEIARAEQVAGDIGGFIIGAFFFVVGAIFYFTVMSRLGTIRDEARKQTALLEEIAESHREAPPEKPRISLVTD